MNAIEVCLQAYQWASDLMEMVMADVTPEQAAWVPPGIANPLGATYAHAALETDAMIQHFVRGEAPLYETTWASKTGVSQPQMGQTLAWGRALQVELPALREYARAVYRNTEQTIAALSEEDLEREVDLSPLGEGKRTLNWLLQAMVIGHLHNVVGEISALKGIQGAKGYPF